MESAGEARPGIWIATTKCWVRRAAWHHCCRVETSTTPHTLSCTNQHLSMVTTREEGSTLCDVSVICVGNVGIICSYVDRCRTVLVMSDMKARLTSSRVVPSYTSYTGHTVAAAAAW